LVARNRQENRSIRRDLHFDTSVKEASGEETSPVFLPQDCTPAHTRPRTSSLSTPLNTHLSRSYDHEKQFQLLQCQIATLTEKIDYLKESTSSAAERIIKRDENLPRDLVVSGVFI